MSQSGMPFLSAFYVPYKKQGHTEVGMVWTQSEDSLSVYSWG